MSEYRPVAGTRKFAVIAIVAVLACGRGIDAEAQVTARVFASGLSVPVAFVQDPTDDAVQFVVEQSGRIRVLRNGTILPTDFLNLASAIAVGGEQGLLGLAFAPDYAASGRFFVNFTNTDATPSSRDSADPATRSSPIPGPVSICDGGERPVHRSSCNRSRTTTEAI